ncbi:CapA family protein [Vibrio lentus]
MKIAFVGDIALFGKYDLSNNPKAMEQFTVVKRVLDDCDYRIGNLETPFVSSSPQVGNKSAYISSDPKNVEILKLLKFDAVSLSNNHVFDFGLQGLNETISVLEKNGIEWFGANGKDLIVDELKIALHGYCSFNTNPIGMQSENGGDGIHPLIAEEVRRKMLSFSSQGLFNILSVHSGVENVNMPSLDDIIFARDLSASNDYIYFGHHPHVVQGLEISNNSLLAYSLGNFCFDDIKDKSGQDILVEQTDNSKSSFILIVELINGRVDNFWRIPIYLGKEHITINQSKVGELIELSDSYLTYPPENYTSLRDNCIKNVVKLRNSNRNFRWIIQRLSMSTLIRVVERRINTRKYKKLFSSKL